MAASDDSSYYFTEFTLAEIVDMENLYKELGDQSLQKDFCQTVASTFSCSVNRNGKSSVTWKQVQSWFQEKLKQQSQPKFKTFPSSPLQILDLSNPNFAGNAVNVGNATYVQRRKGTASDVSDLAFEAKSARDYACSTSNALTLVHGYMFSVDFGKGLYSYDVSSFLTYRVLRTGELEVRVRFSGFDNGHDEWVNVRTSVRERSIPVEPSECGRVNVGDLLLCFQEREDQALYCDAHVVNIKRGIHDHSRCNCVFLVRYDLDNTEEAVGVERICRRPEE